MDNLIVTALLRWLKGKEVDRPNAGNNGTLSGHAAGEPFEKLVYHRLKAIFPTKVFKQYEFLNDLYRRNPSSITVEDKKELFDSPIALFLLSRGESATKSWNPQNIFEEKQNDTADILYHDSGNFTLIDVKTRNMGKKAMAPNIISAYKVARMCALMIDNNDYDSIDICYVEIEWNEIGATLKCSDAYCGYLFKANPDKLYINWAAAMQIQFHVSELDQTYTGTREEWARAYLKIFVNSAKERCDKMYKTYVQPFEKYILKSL